MGQINSKYTIHLSFCRLHCSDNLRSIELYHGEIVRIRADERKVMPHAGFRGCKVEAIFLEFVVIGDRQQVIVVCGEATSIRNSHVNTTIVPCIADAAQKARSLFHARFDRDGVLH